MVKHTKKKPSPAKKHPIKHPAKSAAPAHSRSAKVKAAPAAKPAVKPNGNSATKSPIMEKPSKKNALRDSILKRKASAKPIVFSLDEVRAIAQTVTSKTALP